MRTLKPTLPMLRSTLPRLQHRAPDIVKRIDGNTLRAVKKRLLARSGALCECPDCLASGYRLKLTWATCQADHIVPLYQGGTNAFTNFRALHVTCHAKVTAQQAAERAASGRTWSDDL